MYATKDKSNAMGVTYMKELKDAWIVKAMKMENKTFTAYLNLVKRIGE